MEYQDLIRKVSEMDLPATTLAAFGAGVLMHWIIFRTVEVERYLRLLIATFAIITPLSIYQYSVFSRLSFLASALRATVVLASFFGGLSTSIVLYRAFFHPLRHFPGPPLARVTKLYGAWLAGRNTMYYKELEEMHRKYGDFVRVGPRELSIKRQSAVEIIYGPRSKCPKSTWYDQVSTSDAKSSVHMTRDPALHRRRRKVWDRAFTPKALEQYLPQILSKVTTLTDQISTTSPTPLDTTLWSMLLAFDIMGLVGLGRDFNGVSSGTRHPAIRALHSHMRMLWVMSQVPWLLNLLSLVPGATAGYAPFFGFCVGQVGEKMERERERMMSERGKGKVGGEVAKDVMAWLIAAFEDPEDADGVPSRAALDEDSRVVIVAGSETTATTLATVLYYMAKRPEVQKRLQAALDGEVGEEWTYERARGCALLDHVISETMRLHPPVLTGAPRETPAGGITVDEVQIPGGVNVIVGFQGIQTDTRYWGDRAKEFVPERWGEKGGRSGPYMPFSIGAHQCPGKPLALMSLRCSISKILQNFDVAFAPGEDGTRFENEVLDTFTTSLPPCHLVFRKRVKRQGEV